MEGVSVKFSHRRRQGAPIPVTPIPLPAPTTSLLGLGSMTPPPATTASNPQTVAGLNNSVTSTLSSIPSASSNTSSIYSSLTPTTTNLSGSLPQFKFVYLVPVIAVAGVILLISLIWLIQGCVTRKPRVNEDDPESIGGPRYAFIDGEARQIEAGDTALEKTTRYPYPEEPDSYRWPRSYQESPSPTEASHAPPSSLSDATSLALLDVYESDEEVDHAKQLKEGPWESLRHKSIKRGILENVRKERNWMDSLRAVAGSAFVNQGGDPFQEYVPRQSTSSSPFRTTLRDDGPVPSPNRRPGSESAPSWIDKGRRRRMNTQEAAPCSRTGPRPTTRRKETTGSLALSHHRGPSFNSAPGSHDAEVWTAETGFKIIQESPVTSPLEAFGSAALSLSPSKSNDNRSRSNEGHVSILPMSPPLITSPPLENQLCFTPIPGIESVMPTTGLGSPKGRKGRRTSSLIDIDKPLPDPRTVHPERPARLEKRRPKFLRKRSTKPDSQASSLPSKLSKKYAKEVNVERKGGEIVTDR